MSSLSQFSSTGNIKSIQRGVITISTNTSSSSVTINSVNTSKSVLHYLGQSTSSYNSGYGTYGGSGASADAYLTLSNSTTITATRTVSSTNYIQYISYQIVEYY